MISRKKQPRGEVASNEHHHSTPRRELLRQNRGTVLATLFPARSRWA
jgi:hypothetical protein